MKKVVHGLTHLVFVQSEQDMDAGGLDIRIHYADAFAAQSHLCGKVCRGVGLAGTAAEGMYRDDSGHRRTPTPI